MKISQPNLLNYFLICLTLFFTLFLSATSSAAEFDSCLASASKVEHRLNRIESVRICFEKNKKHLDSESCYKGTSTLKTKNYSTEIMDQLKATCFYDVSRFKSVSICLQKAKIFELADSHDEAIFECYSQFQDELNQKQCLAVSELLRYPAKKEYLAEHCLTK